MEALLDRSGLLAGVRAVANVAGIEAQPAICVAGVARQERAATAGFRGAVVVSQTAITDLDLASGRFCARRPVGAAARGQYDMRGGGHDVGLDEQIACHHRVGLVVIAPTLVTTQVVEQLEAVATRHRVAEAYEGVGTERVAGAKLQHGFT